MIAALIATVLLAGLFRLIIRNSHPGYTGWFQVPLIALALVAIDLVAVWTAWIFLHK